MSNEGALATLDDNKAIAEIASGTLSKQIAERYGVTPYAVRKRLAKHPEYKAAINEQCESFVEDSVYDVMTLKPDADMVAITRARTKADIALKYAAARDPERWGAKQSGNVIIDLGSALQVIAERMQERLADRNTVAEIPNGAVHMTIPSDKA